MALSFGHRMAWSAYDLILLDSTISTHLTRGNQKNLHVTSANIDPSWIIAPHWTIFATPERNRINRMVGMRADKTTSLVFTLYEKPVRRGLARTDETIEYWAWKLETVLWAGYTEGSTKTSKLIDPDNSGSSNPKLKWLTSVLLNVDVRVQPVVLRETRGGEDVYRETQIDQAVIVATWDTQDYNIQTGLRNGES